MATGKSNLTINELDFDTIKSNLKNYLSGQTAYADFNFEGSSINILLDLLAYNTHYTAFYNNMIANEMFLDSAADRENVVSIAKHIGYTPTSRRSSTAEVNVTLGSTAGYSLGSFFPIGQVFTAVKDNKSYSFVNTQTAPVDVNATTNHISGLTIKEGKIKTQSYVYDSTDGVQKFTIPDENVDTTTLSVRVQNSVTDEVGYTDNWRLANRYSTVTSTTRAYFLQESTSGKYQIYFGDGSVGKALSDGNLVTISYLTTNGAIGNGIGFADSSTSRTFTYGSNNSVEVVSASQGGAEKESIDSIRNTAPLSYQAQNRAVTADDYKTLLLQDYPDVDSITIWGGEENDPPSFGTVFISFKPSVGTSISEVTKNTILDTLATSQSMVGVKAEIVDPDYLYIRIRSEINFRTDLASISASGIAQLVRNKIINYGQDNLDKFEKGLRYSKLVKEIDDADASILGNETTLEMEYRLLPEIDRLSSYRFSFDNSIFHPHAGHTPVLYSKEFQYTDSGGTTRDVFFEDDGQGQINIKYFNAGVKTTLVENIGQVDYQSGLVTINNINIKGITGSSYLSIIAPPAGRDVDSRKRLILLIDENDPESIRVTMTSENYTSSSYSSSTTSTSSASVSTTSTTTGSSTSSSSGSGY